MKRIFLLIAIFVIFCNLFAVTAGDNETLIGETSSVSIETSISDETIYIGNQTEATVTVKNVGDCDIDTLSIVNINCMDDVYYQFEEDDFEGPVDNPVFNYDHFEAISGSWYSSHDSGLNSFILNDTLKVNQSFCIKFIFNTTKEDFYCFENVHFYAFLDNITFPNPDFSVYSNTLLNSTCDKITILQIPRTVYVNRTLQNDSLIVDAMVSSLDNSVFSGDLYVKVADLVGLEYKYTRTIFEKAKINFINNTGNASLKLPLNTVEEYITGLVVGVPKDDVYSYGFVYDSFDESQIQPTGAHPSEATINLLFSANDLVKIYKNDTQFVVDARDTPYENITFKVNGVSYVRQVNESGFAKLNINLNPGVYTIESSTQYYSVNNTITVLPTLVGDNLVKYYRNDSQFEIKLVDSKGNPAASQIVTFNINGVFYSRQTNDEGIARLNINLEPGEYVITATDPLTGLKMSYNITVLPKMYAEDVVASYGDTYYYTVKLVDDMGCALPGKTVNFNIGGLLFNSITDSDGLVKVCIGLMPGKYIVTAEYMSSKISNSIVILDE